jgi:hypothetical protein
MKRISVAFLLGLTSFVAHAQPITIEKPVVCADPKTVIETMSGPEWREVPFWIGIDSDSKYVMMVNEKTKTWSFIQFNSKVACILGTGEGHKPVTFKTTL